MKRHKVDKHNRHGKQGKGTHGATQHPETHPKRLHLNEVSWALSVTKQDQAHGGRQTWQSLK